MTPESLLASGVPLALAEVVSAEGSSPRDPGAWLLVSAAATAGTIGGGRLEWEVTARARTLLDGADSAGVIALPLGPALGQCCGGHVRVRLSLLDGAGRRALRARLAEAAAARPAVYVFGAGHTGMALARALAPLPLAVSLVDTRLNHLEAAPPGVEQVLSAMPEGVVRAASAGSGFAVMTHDHGLDFLIVSEALGREDAAYVGLVGSVTKRARLERQLAREEQVTAAGLTCPIGAAGLGDKRPEVIALHTAAEIMAAMGAASARRTVGEEPLAVGSAEDVLRGERLAWTR
ncbi:MAG: xanthine dehydrogenase accessory protein XdhC [Pseudomonadota bacterium]